MPGAVGAVGVEAVAVGAAGVGAPVAAAGVGVAGVGVAEGVLPDAGVWAAAAGPLEDEVVDVAAGLWLVAVGSVDPPVPVVELLGSGAAPLDGGALVGLEPVVGSVLDGGALVGLEPGVGSVLDVGAGALLPVEPETGVLDVVEAGAPVVVLGSTAVSARALIENRQVSSTVVSVAANRNQRAVKRQTASHIRRPSSGARDTPTRSLAPISLLGACPIRGIT